ncbi:ABC transporter ATP-binding protein [Chloroflexota bacterium]
MDYPIEIEGLTKTYPNSFTAVSNLNIKIPRGVFGFLGPNGAGKTTTIEILVGAMKPTSGTARILGYDIITDSLKTRRLIGYLPEKPGAYDSMSGCRFLCYMGELAGLSSHKASMKARELLAWSDLARWADSPIARYSAGMRQRLALAQSLMNDPELIFLDEPTANLDPLGRDDFIDKIRELAGDGRSIFISSHIIPEVEQVVDYVAIITRGKLILEGKVEALVYGQEVKEYKIEVASPQILLGQLEHQDFVINAYLKNEQLFITVKDEAQLSIAVTGFCSQNNNQLRLFQPVKRDLQTIFNNAIKKAQVE